MRASVYIRGAKILFYIPSVKYRAFAPLISAVARAFITPPYHQPLIHPLLHPSETPLYFFFGLPRILFSFSVHI